MEDRPICVHLCIIIRMNSGHKDAHHRCLKGLHPWLRDICDFAVSCVAELGIFFSLLCLLFFRGISDFHDGGRLVKFRGGEGLPWQEPRPGQVEPALQTAFIMVCKARRLVKAMQADREINHASSGQGGEPRLGINFVLDGAQVVGWEERPLLLSSPLSSVLCLSFLLALFTAGCDMFALAFPVPPPSRLN